MSLPIHRAVLESRSLIEYLARLAREPEGTTLTDAEGHPVAVVLSPIQYETLVAMSSLIGDPRLADVLDAHWRVQRGGLDEFVDWAPPSR